MGNEPGHVDVIAHVAALVRGGNELLDVVHKLVCVWCVCHLEVPELVHARACASFGVRT